MFFRRMLWSLILAATPFVGVADAPPVAKAEQSADKVSQTKKRDAHEEELQRDREIGKKYAEQVEKELKLSKNQDYIDRIQKIGSELAAVANSIRPRVLWGDPGLNTFEYTFKVVEGKDVNAFSLPGGYIYVYEGLIEYAESDDEIAGVLAHEIAHAAFRHLDAMQKEQSKLQAITLPMILIGILAGAAPTGDMLVLGQMVGLASGSGWSVKAEKSADDGGLQYMLQSRYNPTAMLTFMERLAVDERNRPRIDWGIYQTHPPSRDRADDLTSKIRSAGVPIQRSLVTKTFRVQVKPAEVEGRYEAWFAERKLFTFAGPEAETRAMKAAERLNVFFDQVPELYQISGKNDGRVVGLGKEVFRVTAADAEVVEADIPETTRRAVQAVKRGLYLLAYRVWDIR